MADNNSVTIPNEIKIQMQMQTYLDRSVDYYIFARRAVMLGVVPVGGTLFHVAVEMLLHCGLSAMYSQIELKRKFSKHELPQMWTAFKLIFTSSTLSKFDKFVNHHQQWKELRYPKGNSRGSSIFFGRTKPDPEVMRKNMEAMPKSNTQIEINLEEMDELFTAVIQAIDINPDQIKIGLQRNEELLNLYLDENRYALFNRDKVNSATLQRG